MKVGAEKMASAIADSVAPRHGGSSGDVDLLKGLILGGVTSTCKGSGAVKGTQLEFQCSPDSGVNVAVNEKAQGNVNSTQLAKAFAIFTLMQNVPVRDSWTLVWNRVAHPKKVSVPFITIKSCRRSMNVLHESSCTIMEQRDTTYARVTLTLV